ncbi:UNVERIFIED_ORG: hypothetical protein GGE11_005033 [Mycolicibacterium obuense]
MADLRWAWLTHIETQKRGGTDRCRPFALIGLLRQISND